MKETPWSVNIFRNLEFQNKLSLASDRRFQIIYIFGRIRLRVRFRDCGTPQFICRRKKEFSNFLLIGARIYTELNLEDGTDNIWPSFRLLLGENKIKQPIWKNNHHSTDFPAEAFCQNQASITEGIMNEKAGWKYESFLFKQFHAHGFPEIRVYIAVKFNIFISEPGKKGEVRKDEKKFGVEVSGRRFLFFHELCICFVEKVTSIHSLFSFTTQLFGKPYEDTISKLVFISLPRANIGWKTHT